VALLGVAQELAEGRRVLYLDFEDAAPGIVGRLKALGAHGDDISHHLDYADPAESLHVAASGDLAELLRDRVYSLIVVDGFNAAMTLLGLDLMSNTDVTKFFQMLLKPLERTGSVVAYIDHIGKNAADDSKGGIGAQAKRAMTSGCVIKVKVGEPFGRGMTGKLQMIVDKDRAGHVRGASGGGKNAGVAELVSDSSSGDVTVRLTAPDMATPREKKTGKKSMLMERICIWLSVADHETSKNAIRQAMGGRAADVDTALEALVAQGFVLQQQQGRGFVHSLIRPYTVAEDLASDPDLVHSSDHVPTTSGTNRPGPSNDLVHSSRLYRRDEDESTEAASRTTSSTRSGTGRGSTLDCNGCGESFNAEFIEKNRGYCYDCGQGRR
jgi:hypothetical protein